MRVLLVEDEEKVARFIRSGLKAQGWSVDWCADGNEGCQLATTQSYDVIVLDIMLPGRDGLSILKELRVRQDPVPVLLLTARSELNERVAGLDLGADDYLTKPFFAEELIARLHALVRRAAGESQSVLRAEGLTFNLVSREVRLGDMLVQLTVREAGVLECLLRSPGRVLTRTQILERVWGYDFDPRTNLIDVHIQRLRKKLSPANSDELIETVRGVGYRFRDR